MIGSEVRMAALTFQNFAVRYSSDGVAWRTYEEGWNLTVGYAYFTTIINPLNGKRMEDNLKRTATQNI
jgi:hypothetical protein